MNDIQKRFLLFIFGCILMRTIIVIIAKDRQEWLPVMGYFSMIIAFGFLFIWSTGARQTGPEVFGGKVWWNDVRPIHGLLYLLFGISAIQQNPNSWIILLADVLIGATGFLNFHYKEGNLSKLF